MDYSLRLKKIANKLISRKIDAFLTTHPPHLSYLCGFRGDQGTLLLTPAKQVLLVNSLYYEQAREEVEIDIEIKLIRGSLMSGVGQLCGKMRVGSMAVEKEHISYHCYRQFQGKFRGIDLCPVQNWVESLRQVKEEEEMKCITRAASIANRAFQRIKKFVKPGLSENAVARELEYLLKEEGSEELPFPVIVASGRRSTFPHARPSSKIIEKGEVLLLDFGARYQGYCSDLTRMMDTNIIAGEEKKVYDLIIKAQIEAIKSIKPGVEAFRIDGIARRVLMDGGVDQYFGHGLGHGVGLEVHEQPAISAKSRRKLKENMVFTVEPAVYLPGKFGIRIEDMVRVIKEGCEIISAGAEIIKYF